MRCKGCGQIIGSDDTAGLYWRYEVRAKGKRPYRCYGFGVYHDACAPEGDNVKSLPWNQVSKTPPRELVRDLRRYAVFNEDDLLGAI